MNSQKELFDKLSLACSRKTTLLYSTSFSLAIKLLSKEYQKAIFSIYGFVRLADEIVDTFFGVDQQRALDDFELATYQAIKDRYSSNIILHAFQSVVNTYSIENHLIESFFSSIRSDLSKKKHSSETYDEYVYGSAEVVGLMCLRVFTKNDQTLYESLVEPAKKLGSAFQKVNFFRDIKEDFFEKGRTYFPGFEIEKNLNDVQKSNIEDEISNEFEEALKGIYKLPLTSRFGVLLACRYYKKLFKQLKSTPVEKLFSKRLFFT